MKSINKMCMKTDNDMLINRRETWAAGGTVRQEEKHTRAEEPQTPSAWISPGTFLGSFLLL